MIENTIAENQLLGALYVCPELFDSQKMEQMKPDDFTTPMRRLIFQTLGNMYDSGFQKFSVGKIETYLSKFPNSFEEYNDINPSGLTGRDYVLKLEETGSKDNFDYAFDKIKKFTLLRNLKRAGVDVAPYYDEYEDDPYHIELQNKWLDECSLQKIADTIVSEVEGAVSETVSTFNESYEASFNIKETIDQLQQVPDYGANLPIKVLNEALRGMRLGKFYIYSAGTGYNPSPLQ